MNPPDPILPPTSTLNPTRSGRIAGTSATSCDSSCVQFWTQPATVALNFRGRLVNSGLPFSPTRVASSSATTSEASNNSLCVRPASAQPLMLPTLSIPVCSECRSTPRSFSQISGTLPSSNPRSRICCRGVMSSSQFPRRRETSAIARGLRLLVNPFGILTRIMNFPGVGLRKNTPTHLSRSFSAAVSDSKPCPISRGNS